MKKIMLLFSTLLLIFEMGQSQTERRIRRDDLQVRVTVVVTSVSQEYLHFGYSFENNAASQQSMVGVDIELSDEWLEQGGTLRNVTLLSEKDWGEFPAVGEKIRWNAQYDTSGLDFLERVPRSAILPGEKIAFSFQARGVPGIGYFWVEGWAPWFFSEDERDSLLREGYPESELHATDDKFLKGSTIVRRSLPDSLTPLSFLDTLLSYTARSRLLSWITTDQTADKYTSYFNSVKGSLQQDHINAARSTMNQVLADVDADSSSTLTSEAHALLRFNTEYLLSQLPVQDGGVTPYSLFATHSLHLQQNSQVLSGDVGVNEAGTGPFLDSQVELSIGIGTSTPAGYNVKANRITVKSGSVVHGNVYYNELENNGTITGLQHTPLQLPLVATLHEFKSATPGTQNIEVPQNGVQTLPPGSYGDILVRRNGKLTLTGGTYHLNSFTGGDDVQLLFQSPSELRIARKFDSGEGTTIGPEDTTTMTSDQVIFYVGGINGSNGNLGATPKAAKIGIGNKVRANFYVPNGTLWLRQNSEARGQFIGKDVDVGIGVKVWR